jgi:Asp-tRNA(Asn)/Glu-tRNA(Gln) amidotransferase A subunit family amidase
MRWPDPPLVDRRAFLARAGAAALGCAVRCPEVTASEASAWHGERIAVDPGIDLAWHPGRTPAWLAGRVPEEHADIVQRLERAGALCRRVADAELPRAVASGGYAAGLTTSPITAAALPRGLLAFTPTAARLSRRGLPAFDGQPVVVTVLARSAAGARRVLDTIGLEEFATRVAAGVPVAPLSRVTHKACAFLEAEARHAAIRNAVDRGCAGSDVLMLDVTDCGAAATGFDHLVQAAGLPSLLVARDGTGGAPAERIACAREYGDAALLALAARWERADG